MLFSMIGADTPFLNVSLLNHPGFVTMEELPGCVITVGDVHVVRQRPLKLL